MISRRAFFRNVLGAPIGIRLGSDTERKHGTDARAPADGPKDIDAVMLPSVSYADLTVGTPPVPSTPQGQPALAPLVSGLEGRLVHLVDDARGVWMHSGVSFVALNARVVNVQQFGAKGNGQGDDAPSIQAAIDALGRAGGGTVYLPDGTYPTRSPIVIGENVNGIRIIGAGQHDGTASGATRIDNQSGAAAIEVRWQAGSQSHLGIQLEHFTIDSSARVRPSYAVDATQFRYGCWLRGVRFRNHEVGLRLSNSILYGVYDCYFGDLTKWGIEVVSLGHAARYVGNTFVRCGLSAARLRGNAVWVANNAFEYIGFDGTRRVPGCDKALELAVPDGGFVIEGNYFEENGDGRTEGRANLLVIGGGRGGLIAGNFLDGTVDTPRGTAAMDRNIHLNNVSEVRIVGNLLKGAVGWDVVASHGEGIDARGNSTTRPMALPESSWSGVLTRLAKLNFPAPRMVPGSVDLSISLPGAAVGDEASVGAPVPIGLEYLLAAFVPAPDRVTVRWTQISGTPKDPDGPGGTYRVTVWKH